MLSKSLLTALAATAVSAEVALHPGHIAAKRELEARQTASLPAGGADVACLTALQSAYGSLPTMPADLMSYEEANPPTDACSYTLPASLSGEFSAYETSVLSWYTAHSAELLSALSQCPQYSSMATLAVTGTPVCSAGATGGGGANSLPAASAVPTASAAPGSGSDSSSLSGSSAPTGSGSSSGSGSSTTAGGSKPSSVTTNDGNKKTGFVAAAFAAAGFLGAVAAL